MVFSALNKPTQKIFNEIFFSFFRILVTMSEEQIASCLLCQSTFSNHEELFVHSCEQIKVETNELEDKVEKI